MKLLLENWRKLVALHEGVSPKTIEKIQTILRKNGGESYLVGGAVRDELIPGMPASKDVDFVVRKLPLHRILKVLRNISEPGSIKEVGESFGVITARIEGEDFDFSIPRTSETKTGDKHTDFEVTTDPNAPLEADLGRRDFTMNALAKDSNGQIIDLFGGQDDINNKLIRAVGESPSDRFVEDPLRMLRAIQFATRFGFTIEPVTAKAIRDNVGLITPEAIAGERILEEFQKAWTRGAANSDYLVQLLESTGIGKHVFGQDFDPRPVTITGDNARKALGSAMAFFLHGGDYTRMSPSNLMAEHIELARASITGLEVFQYGSAPTGSTNEDKHREKLRLLSEVLAQLKVPVYVSEAEKIKRVLDAGLPLNKKKLALAGGSVTRIVMQITKDARLIGKAQDYLLQTVHDLGEDLNREQLVDILNDALKTGKIK